MEILGIDIHIPIIIFLILGIGWLIYILNLRKRKTEEVLNKNNAFNRNLQNYINDISRIEDLDDLIDLALEHLENKFGFHYATINIVPFNKSIFLKSKHSTREIKLNHLTCFCKEDSLALNWRDLSHYDVFENENKKYKSDEKNGCTIDIPAQMYQLKSTEAIQVVKNKIRKNKLNITELHLNKEIKDTIFFDDKNKEFTHNDLARLFIPILHRNIFKGGNESENKDDTTLGIIEVGINLELFKTKGDRIFDGDSFSDEIINSLFLYADNFAQLLYKTSLQITRFKIREELAKMKVSDPLFLLSCLELIKDEFGIKYGNISNLDISNKFQLIDTERDVYCNNYTDKIDIKKIGDQINKELFKRKKEKNFSYNFGICNEVINAHRIWQRKDEKERGKDLCLKIENNLDAPKKHSIPLMDDVKSELGLPILSPENNIIGVCVFSANKQNFYNKYHANALSYFGKILGTRLLTAKRYASISRLTEPLNLFEESSITRKLVFEIEKYFGTNDVILWNKKEDKFYPCKKTHSEFKNGRIKLDSEMFFDSSDFVKNETHTVNLSYYDENNDIPILVRSINQLNEGYLKKIGSDYKRILFVRFINNQKYDKIITIFSHRRVEQDAVNEFADEFVLALRDKIEDAFQIHSLFSLLMNYKSNSVYNFYELVINEIIKYTKADVVGIIPILNNNELDTSNSVIRGPLWEKSHSNTYSLSNLILKNGSEIFNSRKEIEEYYIEKTGKKINNEDFAKKLESIAALRLKINLKGDIFYPAILMVEYTNSNQCIEGGKQRAYLNTLKRVLAEVIWNLQQLGDDFNDLNSIIKELNNSYLSIEIAKEEQARFHSEELNKIVAANMELKMLGASAAYFNLFTVLNHELKNLVQNIELGLESRRLPIPDGIKNTKKLILELLNLFNTNKKGKESFKLNEVLKSLIFIIKSDYDILNVTEIGLERDVILRWNKAQFSIMIYNLLNNSIWALKKSKKSNKNIEIECNVDDPKMILVRIKDNGIGIEKKYLPDKIYELEHSTKMRGHGIGLHFVRNTLLNEDANNPPTIVCKSKEKEFTEFTIKIPTFLNYKNND